MKMYNGAWALSGSGSELEWKPAPQEGERVPL